MPCHCRNNLHPHGPTRYGLTSNRGLAQLASYLLGTTSTGDTARLSTVWLTEPNNSPVNPPRPRVPTTTNDAVREASDNTSAGSTSKNRHCTGTLVCCVTTSATCARRDATSLRISGIAVPYIGEIAIHMLLLSGSAVTSVNERLRSCAYWAPRIAISTGFASGSTPTTTVLLKSVESSTSSEVITPISAHAGPPISRAYSDSGNFSASGLSGTTKLAQRSEARRVG